jgi:Vacuolar sorting-associated protein 13, N-terminal/N-terminal region of Chorein or VPS13
MAKKLLLDVLVKVLGEFIELNEDNLDLSLAVWSGHIALKDLKVFLNLRAHDEAFDILYARLIISTFNLPLLPLSNAGQLKTHKLLRNFDLSILHGEIKTLDVTIPWTALLNSPVKVIIDGVNLQVGPLNVAALDKEDTKKRVIAAKMQKLRMVDRFIDFSSGVTSGEAHAESSSSDHFDEKEEKKAVPAPNARATYVQQWTSKIIDNIEITLKNVHIRYEDSQTIPGSPFSAGITLNSFTLSTCDEKWHEKFVARDINKPSSSIRKMAKVYNFGLYWITKSVKFSELSFKDWSSKMQASIYPGLNSAEKSSFSNIQYILHPANNLIVRLIHNERTEQEIPKFDMIVESTNLPISIDRVQYLQLLRTLEMIGLTERRRQPHMYRPYERPNNPENARAWWKYACKMIVKRGPYIRLVKLSKTYSEETGFIDCRTASEKREARELEERMPLRSLVVFRHAAAKEMHSDARKKYLQLQREAIEKGHRLVSQRGNRQRTWIGWAAGFEGEPSTSEQSSPSKRSDIESPMKSVEGTRDAEKDELEGDVSIASIISSLEREDEAVDLTKSAALFRLSLRTSASLDVSVGEAPVASATMALSVLAEVTTWGVSATVQMRDLKVVDRCTLTPAIRNIIAVKQVVSSTSSSTSSSIRCNSGSSDMLDGEPQSSAKLALSQQDSSPSFSVVYENLNGRTVIRISALPLEIAVNKLCVQQLIGLFLAPATASNTTSSSSRSLPNKSDPQKGKKSVNAVESISPKKPVKLDGKNPLNRKSSKFYIFGTESGPKDLDFKFHVVDGEKSDDYISSVSDAAKEETVAGTVKDTEKGAVKEKAPDKSTNSNRDTHQGGHEGDLEIIFEAQAPNIIIPQNSSSDGGYLLLDTGYLAVRVSALPFFPPSFPFAFLLFSFMCMLCNAVFLVPRPSS